MEKVTKIRVKQSDGTFGAAIPIGAKSENITMADNSTLQETMGNIGVSTNGSVKEQLDSLKTKIGTTDISTIGNDVTTAISQLNVNKANNSSLNNYLLKTDISDWAKSSTKPTYTASEVGALASDGNAVSATKATQDGSGNTITSTYLKLTGGTLTNYLNIGVDTDTDPKALFLNTANHVGSIQINTNGTFGAWSHTNSKWVWNCSASGGSVFNGLAIQATQAANGIALGVGAGETLSFNGIYAGHVTGSQKGIEFFIPTSRVLSDTPTCTALSVVVRHADGGYPYARSGTNGATYTPLTGISIWASGKTVRTGEVASISCANRTDGVQVTVTFGYQLAKTSANATAVTNNVPVSVAASGTITFA